MSPFVRDVSQILLDDGSTLRELWAGMKPPKAENGGGGSGTTSRHSVSIVQPCRPAMYGGGSSLQLLDDNLMNDFGVLSLSKDGLGPSSLSIRPPSQPSPLPIYVPMSWSPLSQIIFRSISPSISTPPNGTSFTSRQRFGSPSDSGLSAGTHPSCSQLEQQLINAQYRTSGNNGHGSHQQQQLQHSSLTAWFIPERIWVVFTALAEDRLAYPASTGALFPPASDAQTPDLNDLSKDVQCISWRGGFNLLVVLTGEHR
ncbi:hypothetical protein SCLCIDRAFT_25126 [Scleroderma citrinum Foug A]|uniref:Uncharacterized protein n=1 Tax=Scleroderma citrinum Foug A TaxID=1036808 RepID=A0A0C3E296_9AGAM|nr:hypothetical protein SCLCIDRAFT_25126 [Scleroderma citrinum Foug A]